MTREQVVTMMRAELAAWCGEQPDATVTLAEVGDLQEALNDACENCRETLWPAPNYEHDATGWSCPDCGGNDGYSEHCLTCDDEFRRRSREGHAKR